MGALWILAAVLAAQAALVAVLGPAPVQAAIGGLATATGVPYNTLVVLLGTGLLGLASGVVGTFAVLRRRSLVGDAVAHAALPGVALAFLVLGHRSFGAMLAGAVASGLLGTFLVAWLQRNTRLKGDAAIGIVLSVLFGLGLVLSRIVQDDPSGRQAGLDSFLFGTTAGMVGQDVMLVGLVALDAFAVVLLLFKELELVHFDPAFGAVQGLPVLLLDALALGLLVVVTVIGLPAVGVVLMAALLVIPGVAARFWSDRLGRVLALAAAFGAGAGLLGTLASARWPSLAAGPLIVLSGAALFAVSALVAPRRGVVPRLSRRLALSLRVAREHLLRSLYELTESCAGGCPPVSLADLLRHRPGSPASARLLLALAARRGLVQAAGGGRWRLTAAGLEAARQVVRAHRLWEVFLVQQADIAPDHVDRDADEIEHVLPPEVLEDLERRLQQAGGPVVEPPPSVHPLGAGEGR